MKVAFFDGFQSSMALPSPPAAPVTPDAPLASKLTGSPLNAPPVSLEDGRCVLMGNWNVQALEQG